MPRAPRLKMIFSSILNRDITLVSHQVDDSVDISEMLEDVRGSIRNLGNMSFEQKLTYPFDNLQVHIIVDRGITYLCVTERSDSNYMPFAFLNQVRERFSEQPSLISRSYSAGEDEFDRDFGPVLMMIMDDFISGRADKFSIVEEQLEDVKQIMLANVDKVMERGEGLNDLLSKTQELESQGQEFRCQARTVLVQARCRNLKLWLLIGAMFAAFVTIVILFATGVIKS